MKKLTIKDVKEIAKVMSEEFRIHHGALNLSLPEDTDTRGTIKQSKGFVILLLADFTNNKEENDIDVATKTFGLGLAEKLGIDCSPDDFK